MTAILAEAVAWYQAGFMPIPVATDGSKRPGVKAWGQWQNTRPDIGTIVDLFARTDSDGIGLICGAASGGLELIELEGRAVNANCDGMLEDHFANHGLTDLWRLLGTYTEVTPSGGLHWLLQVNDGPAAPNTKLARDRSGAVLAETRGQGGFVVIAPSAGRTHPTRNAWEIINGGPGVVAQVTTAQRDTIWDMVRLIDETTEATPIQPARGTRGIQGSSWDMVRLIDETTPTPRPAQDGNLRPGDDFAARVTWDEILRPEGWTPMGRDRAGRRYWCRPGKNPSDGHSATTGGADDGVDRMYVFSSNAPPFEPGVPVGKFRAWSLLHCGGDDSQAAAQLRADGYGSPLPEGGHVLTTIPGGAQRATQPPGDATQQPVAVQIGQTEDDLARALVARCADQLRFCPQRGQWLTWTGSRWAWDEGELHREHAKHISRALPVGDQWKAFRRRALSANGIAGVVRLARTDPAIAVHIDDLDAQPWQINTPGGIIDMRTGSLLPPDREQLHTRTTAVTPDYEMPSPVWDAFLTDTFGGDANLISFVQRLIGLSAVGQVVEQILPFAIGPGANGKSTLFEVVMRVLGRGTEGYAMAAQSEMLMIRRHSEHPAELAQLAGSRIVILAEIEDGERFAEARVKQLTGTDSINARFMRGNPFTFTPSHTLWLVGNTAPTATVGGPAFWRRILLIRFDHVVPVDKRDPKLPDKLDAEAPAILAWIARGAADYAAHGLGVPASVKAATADYEGDQDTVARFVEEVCHLAPSAPMLVQAKASALRNTYESWCANTGGIPVSARKFGEQLRDRFGVIIHRGAGGQRIYQGIGIHGDSDEDGRYR